jgi:hypothetical protein
MRYLAPHLAEEEISTSELRRHVYYQLGPEGIRPIEAGRMSPVFDMEGRFAGLLRHDPAARPRETALTFVEVRPDGKLKEQFRVPPDRSYVGYPTVRMSSRGAFALLTPGGGDLPRLADPYTFRIRHVSKAEGTKDATVRVERKDWVIYRYYISPRGEVALEAAPREKRKERHIVVHAADGRVLLDRVIREPKSRKALVGPTPEFPRPRTAIILPFSGGRAAYVETTASGPGGLVLVSGEDVTTFELGADPRVAPVDGKRFCVWDGIGKGNDLRGRLRLIDVKEKKAVWSVRAGTRLIEAAASAEGGYVALLGYRQEPHHRRSIPELDVEVRSLEEGTHICHSSFSARERRVSRFLHPEKDRLLVLTATELLEVGTRPQGTE